MKTRTFLVICAMFMATFFSEAQTQKEIRKQKDAEDFVKPWSWSNPASSILSPNAHIRVAEEAST